MMLKRKTVFNLFVSLFVMFFCKLSYSNTFLDKLFNDDEFDSYHYVGGGLSYSFIDPEKDGSSLYYVSDDNDFGFRLQGGYRPSQLLSLELMYADFGEAEISVAIPPKPKAGNVAYSAQAIHANYFFDKSFLPFELPHEWFVKAGLGRLDPSGSGSIPYSEEKSFHILTGLGVQNEIKNNWQWRADLDLFSRDASAISVGLQYKFIKEKQLVVNEPLDSDQDGVLDKADQCPGTIAGSKVDVNGCVLAKEKVVEEAFLQLDFKGINFEVNSEKLVEDSLTVLQETAKILMMHDTVKIEVQAHSDSDGSAGYNQKLSQRRAEAVKNYLIGQGVNESAISATGMGESQPIADNSTAVGKAANRRVEFHVIQQAAPSDEAVVPAAEVQASEAVQ